MNVIRQTRDTAVASKGHVTSILIGGPMVPTFEVRAGRHASEWRPLAAEPAHCTAPRSEARWGAPPTDTAPARSH